MQAFRFIVFVFLFIDAIGQAPDQRRTTSNLNNSLLNGKFPNGFAYYVLESKTPPGVVEISFINRVGFVDETAPEIQFAHLIEHVAFRSTVHFPEGVDTYFKSKGLNPSRDFYGSTGGETSYNIRIPSNDTALFRNTLLAIKDWASGNILFTDSDVEEERAAILNEIARGDNKVFRSFKKRVYEVFDENPRYRERISDEIDNVRNVDIGLVKAFYEKWYQPERQALVIVGDVNNKRALSIVEELFKNISPGSEEASSTTRLEYDVPLTGKNKIIIGSNGLQSTDIDINLLVKRKHPRFDFRKAQDNDKSQLIDRLCNILLAERFRLVSLVDGKSDHEISAGLQRSINHPLASIDAISIATTTSSHDNVLQKIDFVLTELRRLQLWGFTESELKFAKQIIARAVASEYRKPDSRQLKEILFQAASDGNFQPQLDLYSHITKLIDPITLTDINSLVATWLNKMENVDVIISAPDSQLLNIRPLSTDILERISASNHQKMARWVSNHAHLNPAPVAPAEYKKMRIDEAGAIHILLKNRIKVIFKPIPDSIKPVDSEHEIRILGYDTTSDNAGLNNLVCDAIGSNRIEKFISVSSLGYSEYREWISRQNRIGHLSAAPYVTQADHGITGTSSITQYNELLTLIYNYFVVAHIDEGAFKSLETLDKTKSLTDPTRVVEDSIRALISPGRLRKVSNEVSEQCKLSELSKLYKNAFSNRGNLTFIISGFF